MEKAIFEVGLTLYIESYYKTRLATQVLGWEKDAFVLTKAIYVQGLPVKLKANDVCKIRFLKDGAAYGFETEVVTIQYYPYPLMFLKYPGNIQCIQFRVAPRFRVNIPAEFLDASGSVISEAVVVDLSVGGCGLQLTGAEGQEFSLEAGYAIKFKIMDKEFHIICRMVKIDKAQEASMLGMQFSEMTPHDKETLSLVLDFLAKHGNRG